MAGALSRPTGTQLDSVSAASKSVSAASKDVGSAVTAASSASDKWVFANATTASGNTYYLCAG